MAFRAALLCPLLSALGALEAGSCEATTETISGRPDNGKNDAYESLRQPGVPHFS
jgi:hypothetical protein